MDYHKKNLNVCGRGRSVASASLLAAKTELFGTLDAMPSEDREAEHPIEVTEWRYFYAVGWVVHQVL